MIHLKSTRSRTTQVSQNKRDQISLTFKMKIALVLVIYILSLANSTHLKTERRCVDCICKFNLKESMDNKANLKEMDLVFILDSRTGPKNEVVLRFIKYLMRKLPIDKIQTRIGVIDITYSEKVLIHLSIVPSTSGQDTTYKKLKNRRKNVTEFSGIREKLREDRGFELALNMLARSRKESTKHLIVLSDVNIQDRDKKTCFRNVSKQHISELQRKGVEIIVIGFGKDSDMKELYSINFHLGKFPTKVGSFGDGVLSEHVNQTFEVISKHIKRTFEVISAEKTCVTGEIYDYPCYLEKLVNMQIGVELYALHIYMNMGHFFGREDKNFPGTSKFFHDRAKGELEHAQKLMHYQQKRGGRIAYNLTFPDPGMALHQSNQWSNISEAFKHALELEKGVTDCLLCLHFHAKNLNDVYLQYFLASGYIPEQYESMKILANYVKTLERISEDDHSGMADYQFDMITLKGQKHLHSTT